MEPCAREDEGQGGGASGRSQGTAKRGSYASFVLAGSYADASALQNKDLAVERDSAQTKFDDLQEQVEHSLLDKEIAESELEEATARLKELEERVGELEIEVEVVREENGAYQIPAFLARSADTRLRSARLEGLGDAEIARAAAGGAEGEEGTAAPSSLAFRQLEKQNARLKDALIK